MKRKISHRALRGSEEFFIVVEKDGTENIPSPGGESDFDTGGPDSYHRSEWGNDLKILLFPQGLLIWYYLFKLF